MRTHLLLLLCTLVLLSGCAHVAQAPMLKADVSLVKLSGGDAAMVTSRDAFPWTELRVTMNGQPCRGTPITLPPGDRFPLSPEDCGQAGQAIKSVGLASKEGQVTYTF
ncbi:MAG: hypothetical protein HY558_01850 [Euryarchaeota archaeon]|nr:hypothetical protein [Euryarchaeota archaeon]